MNIYGPEYFESNKRYSITKIQNAIDNKGILYGTVKTCDSKLTLKMDLGDCIEGNIAIDNLERVKASNTKASAMSKVGKTVKFIPISMETIGNKTIVKCSRALAQTRCYDEFISQLQNGDIVEALAMKYEPYGIFCDIGCGITALLPTGKIRVPHIVNPCKENKCIKKLYAVINNIDNNGKIELTHKELLGTWREEIKNIQVGETRLGKVLQQKEYGYFIMISQNLQGLAEGFAEDLAPGDTVSVRILYINEEKAKIKLQIMGRVEDQPVFDGYRYTITSGHIKHWEYHEKYTETSSF